MERRAHYRKEWCGCCDLKSATMVAGTFVMTLSFVQFMLILFYLIAFCVANSQFLGMMLNTVLGGYVGLAAFDLLMIIMSIAMMERNAREENKTVLLVWLILMAIYVLFEAALNITFFIMMGIPFFGSGVIMGGGSSGAYGGSSGAYGGSSGAYGYSNSSSVLFAGIVVYWLLKLGMYISCMIAVHWRWHELMKIKDAAYAGSVQRSAAVTVAAPMAIAPAPQPVVYQTVQQPAYQTVQQPIYQAAPQPTCQPTYQVIQPAQNTYGVSPTPAITYKIV